MEISNPYSLANDRDIRIKQEATSISYPSSIRRACFNEICIKIRISSNYVTLSLKILIIVLFNHI